MRPYAALLLLPLALTSCKPPEGDHITAIIGAVLIDGQGGPPMSDSVVVVGGGLIREAGAHSAVMVPEQSDKVDGAGKFVVPAPLDVYSSAEAAKSWHAVQMFQVDRAALESAHEAGNRVIGHVSTQAAVSAMVDGGAAAFVGMITDTEDLKPGLLARLRDLRIAFAPALVSQGAKAEIAERNTKRLFAAGVPIALATDGGDPQRELELLVDAGIPPGDVIVAATRNSAEALGVSNDRGTIQSGKRADLLLLSANPGEDIRNMRQVARRMSAGNWAK